MRILCLLILLVASLPVMAQQTADQESESGQQAAEQTGDNAQNTDGQTGETAPEEGEETEEEDDQTGRFIPSEQISRDLGVSFPTDI